MDSDDTYSEHSGYTESYIPIIFDKRNPDTLEELAAIAIISHMRYPNCTDVEKLPLPNSIIRYLKQIKQFLLDKYLGMVGVLYNHMYKFSYESIHDFILSSPFLRKENYTEGEHWRYVRECFDLDSDSESSSEYESYNSDSSEEN
jgi:hypothetical protein